MKKAFTSEQIHAFTSGQLYRLLIKNIRYYPSINRVEIYKEIKESFRNNKNLDDEKLRNVERKKAAMGLAHILMYNEKSNELQTLGYNTKSEYETLNPKDDNFIFF